MKAKKCASNKSHSRMLQEPPRSRLSPNLRTRTERREQSGNAPEKTLPAFSVRRRLRFVSRRVHGWAQVRASQRAHHGEVGRLGALAAKRSKGRCTEGQMVGRFSRRRAECSGEGC